MVMTQRLIHIACLLATLTSCVPFEIRHHATGDLLRRTDYGGSLRYCAGLGPMPNHHPVVPVLQEILRQNGHSTNWQFVAPTTEPTEGHPWVFQAVKSTHYTMPCRLTGNPDIGQTMVVHIPHSLRSDVVYSTRATGAQNLAHIFGHPIEQVLNCAVPFRVPAVTMEASGVLVARVEPGDPMHTEPVHEYRDVFVERGAITNLSTIELGPICLHLPDIPELAVLWDIRMLGLYGYQAISILTLRDTVNMLPESLVVGQMYLLSSNRNCTLYLSERSENIMIAYEWADLRTAVLQHILPDQDVAALPLNTDIPVNLPLKEILQRLVDAYERTSFPLLLR